MVMASTREEDGEFSVAVGPATRILTQLDKVAGCKVKSAIWSIWVIYQLNWVSLGALVAVW